MSSERKRKEVLYIVKTDSCVLLVSRDVCVTVRGGGHYPPTILARLG